MAATDAVRKYLNQDRAVDLLSAWRTSGASLKEFAESHSMSEATLLRWQRRLHSTTVHSREITPAFVQVQPMVCGDITVHAHGVTIQIPAALLEQSLSSVIRALRC